MPQRQGDFGKFAGRPERSSISLVAAPQPRPSDSFVERFSTLVSGSQKRRVDLELRTLDVLIAGFFLLVLSPLIGLLALALLATSGRPLLYRGERVGRDGRIFQMLKFRTLRRGAEERLGPYLGEELVQRTREETTRVGRRLRAASPTGPSTNAPSLSGPR